MKKRILTTLILATMAIAGGNAFAADNHQAKTAQVHIQQFRAAPHAVNCYQHNTDICIVNDSGETIYFSIPQFNYHFLPLSDNEWADAYSGDYYPALHVKVFNDQDQLIFNQRHIPNHSIVEIDPSLKGHKQLLVKVR